MRILRKMRDEDARAERIWGRKEHGNRAKMQGKIGVVSEEKKKPSTQLSPCSTT